MTKFLFLVLVFTCFSFVNEEKTTSNLDRLSEELILDIVPGNPMETNTTDLSTKKDRDVEVYRQSKITTNSKKLNHTYSIKFFHNINGELNEAGAILVGLEMYTKAAIRWENDSTIAVRLFHPSRKQSYSLKAWGFKGGGGMSFDD